jgi:hypothetical protein
VIAVTVIQWAYLQQTCGSSGLTYELAPVTKARRPTSEKRSDDIPVRGRQPRRPRNLWVGRRSLCPARRRGRRSLPLLRLRLLSMPPASLVTAAELLASGLGVETVRAACEPEHGAAGRHGI